MHPEDAERLEDLEFNVGHYGADLERLLKKSQEIFDQIQLARQRFSKAVQARDDFKSAMQGMGCETK